MKHTKKNKSLSGVMARLHKVRDQIEELSDAQRQVLVGIAKGHHHKSQTQRGIISLPAGG